MPERIFIGVAWPYANGPIHVGHLAGCYLAADIFARYHRAIGSQVLMVSGSDQHGTPITVLAEKEGVTPQAIVDRYHPGFVDTWRRLGITFDLFTTTGTENHARTFREVFDALHKKGVIYKASMPLPYCHTCKRFLPDRYVEGTCPFCGFQGARGDQCDNCGKTLDPVQLIDLKCRISGDKPEIQQSEHLFFKLSDFQQPLLEWVRRQEHWRPNVRNFTLGYLEEGLKDRAITRDISWGVPVPLEGWESKRIYVWFEAVCGYLSASKEWAQRQGKPEAWRDFWQGADCRSYYFIGKDNIPFHTIIWPALLLGHGGLNLPYDVPANEFMNLEGRKLSTSRNWAVWAPDYLDKFDPDPLRYYLSAAMPETSDADFSWREFLRRNNDELVATYGNLVHRVLTFSYRNFDKCVPEPGPLGTDEAALLSKAQQAVNEAGANLGACKFKLSIGSAFSLAQEANRYLDSKAPWATIKTDRRKAATTLWTAIQVIAALKTALYPFLPFSAARLHATLNLPGAVETAGWTPARVPGGHAFNQPQPLFRKLERSETDAEMEKLRQQSGG